MVLADSAAAPPATHSLPKVARRQPAGTAATAAPLWAEADETQYYAGIVEDLMSRVTRLLCGRPFPRRSEQLRSRTGVKAGPTARAAATTAREQPDQSALSSSVAAVDVKLEMLLARLPKAIVQLEMELDKVDGGVSAGATPRRVALALDVLEYKANLVAAVSLAAGKRPRRAGPASSAAADEDEAWTFVTDDAAARRLFMDRFDVADIVAAAEVAEAAAAGSDRSLGCTDAAARFFEVAGRAQAGVAHEAFEDGSGAAPSTRPVDEAMAELRSVATALQRFLAAHDPEAVTFIAEIAAAAVDAASVPRTPPVRPVLLQQPRHQHFHQPADAAGTTTHGAVPVPPLASDSAAPHHAAAGAYDVPLASSSSGAFDDSSPPQVLSGTQGPEDAASPPLPAGDDADEAGEETVEIPEEALVLTEGMKITDIARAVAVFYQRFNPEKVSDVPQIIQAFEGRYGALFDSLNHKYLGLPPLHLELEADMPEQVRPLRFNPRATYDEIISAVQQFYRSVAPAKVADAELVVLRHREQIPLLFEMLNAKYLAHSGPPLPLARLTFDSTLTQKAAMAERTARLSADHTVQPAAAAAVAGVERTSSMTASSAGRRTRPPTPPEEPADRDADVDQADEDEAAVDSANSQPAATSKGCVVA